MSRLSVFPHDSPEWPNKVLTHFDDIVATLAEHGVQLSRWRAEAPIALGDNPQACIAAYRQQLDKLTEEYGPTRIEVASVVSDYGANMALREPGLVEQRLGADECHWVVAGNAALNLHVGEHVYVLLLAKDDLVRLPAGLRQWFDLGEQPNLVAFRLFTEASEVTHDPIARHFGPFEL